MRIRGKHKVPDLLQKSASVLYDKSTGVLPAQLLASYRFTALEIGCGRGAFLTQLARSHPDTLCLGVEKFIEIIARAASLAVSKEIQNIRFIHMDINDALNVFPQNSIDIIYLNFSDPWPRRRNDLKRLTHVRHLAIYRKLLRDNGALEFKTDNAEFFEWSLQSFRKDGWIIQEIDRNVSDLAPFGEAEKGKYIQTEYEQKFRKLGMPIFHVRVTPNEHIVDMPLI
ncbi:tRNA (guanosine(46)-N7)-methyltransferase TrmB [Sulfoacidibacillus thermotolerans]|uniref:tRNA (guanine-N(7)-)-methyltransferase n=1 Tax=Sulfoacidibacillus thermotolerans TaxID=1765684 RepID=A0A2U3DB73_SULT2|nr:tRNA (guanosine(46)-N7)-methyltransferase TrmB [Sulfoacidibacillus thermotolerans]PWI58524.1 tRNA (guanosine(46)-N7)-methyltransferase TrmB [Sulfoacidibacillus thermotolerans]